MAALASYWLRHFRLLLWNRWTEFNETWEEARSLRPLPSLCFLGWSENQDGRPVLWLAETFLTSSLKPLNGIKQNLKGSKMSTPSTKFVFFGPIGKTRWPPWPLNGWDIFDFSSEISEQNSTKLDTKQDLNALYQVYVFWADRKNKMAALASDWLRHFWLLLWNCWAEFNETWQEARSQSPLPSLFFFRSIRKTRWPPRALILCTHCSQVSDSGPLGLLLNLVNTIQTEPFQLGPSNLVHILLIVDFQGQGSKVKVQRYILMLNLVNTIQTEPLKLGPSNLVHILLMTRGQPLLIFKVRGQRSHATHCYLTL